MNAKATMTDIFGTDKHIHAHGHKKDHASGSLTVKRTCAGKLLQEKYCQTFKETKEIDI